MSRATKSTDTERVIAFLRERPGSSVMEIRFALFISAVTQRMSDGRTLGYEFPKYRDDRGVYRFHVVEPGQGTLGLVAS